MRGKLLLIFIGLFTWHLSWSQDNKITGPLGVYHISAAYSYGDTMGADSVLMQYKFRIGEMAIPNERSDGRFRFKAELDSCISWHANRVMGIINPPSEKGVYNQPRDTSLYFTHAVSGTGMIQGAQRFSRLSQIYGPLCGVIFDDWNGDTAITRDMYYAVKGKYVDGDGNVFPQSVSTTPGNKLYTVFYNTDPIPAVLPYMDGLYFSYVDLQNCCYTNLDDDITKLRVNFPGKEIMIAIFIRNSHIDYAEPEGVQYMLAHALDRYDDGDINQVNLFAGSYLIMSAMTEGRWDSLALPHWLDSLYYPYLGQGQGVINNCNEGTPLSDAFVQVYCKGRVSGDTLFRSRQKSDASGAYSFGLWAGNRSTDSTYYWLTAEKEGYSSDTVGFWIRRGDTTSIQTFSLCASPDSELHGDMTIYPNPTRDGFKVHTDMDNLSNAEMEVYDLMGRKVYSTIQTTEYSYVDMTGRANGVYILAVRNAGREISRKRVVLMK